MTSMVRVPVSFIQAHGHASDVDGEEAAYVSADGDWHIIGAKDRGTDKRMSESLFHEGASSDDLIEGIFWDVAAIREHTAKIEDALVSRDERINDCLSRGFPAEKLATVTRLTVAEIESISLHPHVHSD